MSSLILVAGIVLAAGLALAELRPSWRLPALAVALLAIPGNVDNLMPAMRLDPHAIANNTAPAVSVIDLLLCWAVVLTLRERRSDLTNRFRPFLVGAGLLVAAGALVSVVAVMRGVEPAAALRGTLLLLRVLALLFLASRLGDEIGDGSLVAAGICVGAVVLLGNGVYTTLSQHLDRFTATTFGRNGFADVLVAISVVATGLALRTWNTTPRSRKTAVQSAAFAFIAVATLYASITTGTRMAVVSLAVAGAAAVMVTACWKSRPEILRAAAVAAAAVAVIVLATFTFSAADRTVSIITEPGSTLTNPTSDIPTQPGQSELRSRLDFWSAALRMAKEQPLDGVGAFQWNIHRYDYAPGPIAVVDTHDSYLQLTAEFGIPVLLIFLALIGFALVTLVPIPFVAAIRDRSPAIPGTAIGLAAAAVAFAAADVTNSDFFNVRIGAFEWLIIGTGLSVILRQRAKGTPQPGPAEGA